jgi:hypothetical protein
MDEGVRLFFIDANWRGKGVHIQDPSPGKFSIKVQFSMRVDQLTKDFKTILIIRDPIQFKLWRVLTNF